ncbi:alpha/beta fold hydrolase [Streptomyces massasporeus]|uniref:alpha/beta fold hydrolase n=1 Tax=Streptomyces massasporeus TaxID=67324 RepID=UPI0033A6F32D
MVPAMGARARFYAPFARGLHRGGLHVAITDLRGQGESIPVARRGVAYGYREMVDDDFPAVVRAVSAAFPGSPVVPVGHSLGGQLALLSSATGLPGVHAVVLTAAGSVWPPSATDHLLQKITAAPVSRWHYTEALAGGRRLDHFRWVRHSDGMSAYITDWISGTLIMRQNGVEQHSTQQDPVGEGRPED